jgi:hypothetical protein
MYLLASEIGSLEGDLAVITSANGGEGITINGCIQYRPAMLARIPY